MIKYLYRTLVIILFVFLVYPLSSYAQNQVTSKALLNKLNTNVLQVKELLVKVNKARLLGSSYSWTRNILLNSAKGYLFTGILPSWIIWFLNLGNYKTMSNGAQALIDLTELKIPEIVSFLQIINVGTVNNQNYKDYASLLFNPQASYDTNVSNLRDTYNLILDNLDPEIAKKYPELVKDVRNNVIRFNALLSTNRNKEFTQSDLDAL